MEAKYTKGPWEIIKGMSGHPSVKSQNGKMVATLSFYPGEKENWDEIDANAKLISAAPDLLEALIGLLGVVNFSDSDFIHLKNAHEAAVQAIAKATTI